MDLSESVVAARKLRLEMLDDPHRPAYHFVVPEGLARPADPNGAICWNGRYHLGYIYQEAGIHRWGHVSSLDLLHWRHHRPWIVPTDDSPEIGIYSGNCFINKQGEATMLYHGVGSGNSVATSSDPQLDSWLKLPTVSEPHEVIRSDGWLGRFLFLEPMIATMRGIGGSEAARILEELKTDREMLLLARDSDGEPYLFHNCDVRDIVQGLLLLLERPAAVGEAFNLSGAAPFSFDQAVPYLSEKTGIPFVEARIPGMPIRVHHSTAKARSLLGYQPHYDIFASIDSALELQP